MASLPPVSCLPETNGENYNGEGPVMCRNLRPAEGASDRLVPVEDFGSIAADMLGARVLGTITHPVYGKGAVL